MRHFFLFEQAPHLAPFATQQFDKAAPVDLVFLDPPYGKALGEAALQSAKAQGWISPDAIVVWEEGTPPAPPQGFALLDQRRYGDTWVTILRAPE